MRIKPVYDFAKSHCESDLPKLKGMTKSHVVRASAKVFKSGSAPRSLGEPVMRRNGKRYTRARLNKDNAALALSEALKEM